MWRRRFIITLGLGALAFMTHTITERNAVTRAQGNDMGMKDAGMNESGMSTPGMKDPGIKDTTMMKEIIVPDKIVKVVKTDAEWRKILTPEQYEILRKKGTERAFSGKYWNLKDKGIYVCAACGLPLFSSETKFDSGTGWPSFYAPIEERVITSQEDRSWFMTRNEVLCARCGGHLGHVFDDGPAPTGLRYCLNSAALEFVPAQAAASGK